ncbi:MAG: cysteine--tRNA ligase [Nitrospirae bacterium]|nr:cysteine--tRNA ligase [Nitrospirota bacterium]
MRIYNTLKGEKEDFIPLRDKEVKMYVCGPTVYDLSHIGHARSAVAFDVVCRYLKYRGYKVVYVRNYTDVDDKIIKKANEEGVSSEVIAEGYIKAFDEDMDALDVSLPDFRPKVTETMPEIIRFVQTLIDKGIAYVVDGDVYYSVRRFEGYGKLSGKKIEELEAGARVEVDERKNDPLDFALWKASKEGEPWWDSPWGKGRPGWHIECSAMSQKFLGGTLDIHGGGKDLIFPHHENEMAQSEAATGRLFVRYWMHNGFVNINQEKMSKSIGNILSIRDALKNCSAEAVRLFLLSSHYRSPIDYSPDALSDAETSLGRFYTTLQRMEKEWPEIIKKKADKKEKERLLQPVIDAMDDDFNTALAIGHIFNEGHSANRLMDEAGESGNSSGLILFLPAVKEAFKEIGSVLGVFNKTTEIYFNEKKKHLSIPEDEIRGLIEERNKARRTKEWARADQIRRDLEEKGIVLEDRSDGTIWKVKR